MANRKEISRVLVLCDNEDQGCQWTGQLSELEVRTSRRSSLVLYATIDIHDSVHGS